MSSRKMNGDVLEISLADSVVLCISEKMVGDTMCIKVSGEIRNEVAHDFEDEIMAAFSVCDKVRIDMSETTYIASLAMKILLSVQQIVDENSNASLTITNLSAEVHEMFEESGFIDIFNIEK